MDTMDTLAALELAEANLTNANARAQCALEYAALNNAAVEDSVFAATARIRAAHATCAARAQLEATATASRIHARTMRSQAVRAFFSNNATR